MNGFCELLFKIIFQGIRTPPPTGIELYLTAFIRILLLIFVVRALIKGFLETQGIVQWFQLFHLLWMPVVLYGMLEGQFSMMEACRNRSDPRSKMMFITSTIVLAHAVVIVIWLMIIM
jgi:hypothetical protein